MGLFELKGSVTQAIKARSPWNEATQYMNKFKSRKFTWMDMSTEERSEAAAKGHHPLCRMKGSAPINWHLNKANPAINWPTEAELSSPKINSRNAWCIAYWMRKKDFEQREDSARLCLLQDAVKAIVSRLKRDGKSAAYIRANQEVARAEAEKEVQRKQ